jgi:hypothetical protein
MKRPGGSKTYAIMKRGKWMQSHSYATGTGESFSWTSDSNKARRFTESDRHHAESLAQLSNGRVVEEPT